MPSCLCLSRPPPAGDTNAIAQATAVAAASGNADALAQAAASAASQGGSATAQVRAWGGWLAGGRRLECWLGRRGTVAPLLHAPLTCQPCRLVQPGLPTLQAVAEAVSTGTGTTIDPSQLAQGNAGAVSNAINQGVGCEWPPAGGGAGLCALSRQEAAASISGRLSPLPCLPLPPLRHPAAHPQPAPPRPPPPLAASPSSPPP